MTKGRKEKWQEEDEGESEAKNCQSERPSKMAYTLYICIWYLWYLALVPS